MNTLHIVLGGIANGDKAFLERKARLKQNAQTWIVPKSVKVGDEVVIFILGHGFFATGCVGSLPRRRTDWANQTIRYGASLTSICLIKPPISLGVIRQTVPELRWAKYPRSITTPPPSVARRVRNLIARRRRTGLPDLKEKVVKVANIDELRKLALSCARPNVVPMRRSAHYRVGSQAIHRYVLCRANGHCEGCNAPAPFRKSDRSPYLEPHHTTRLADNGPDHPRRVIGLCPNCHRHAHYGADAKDFNSLLKEKLGRLETRR